MPFTVTAAGAITSVDTGISLGSGLCGWQIGVFRREALLGSTQQPGGSAAAPWTASVNVNTSGPSGFCPNSSFLVSPPGTTVSLRNLDWAMTEGDYFLVAAWMSDMEEAAWYTNSSLLSDQWALQAIGSTPYSTMPNPCGGAPFSGEAPWSTLQNCGIAPQATPLARIGFEPAQVSEPAGMALVLVALGLLAAARGHRSSGVPQPPQPNDAAPSN